MQQINGRISNSAKIETVNGKPVVKFDIAYDAGYYTKGEYQKRTVFYHCTYWVNTGVANLLTKGTPVSVFGDLVPKPYKKNNGELDAGLNFHTQHIDITGNIMPRSDKSGPQDAATDFDTGAADDLPF